VEQRPWNNGVTPLTDHDERETSRCSSGEGGFNEDNEFFGSMADI
jgi:hypothetical protein